MWNRCTVNMVKSPSKGKCQIDPNLNLLLPEFSPEKKLI